jgi:Flp pilus assembly protein TadG
MLIPSRRQSRGVATVEFVVVSLFALLPMLLGTLQVALLLVANHHVDYAAFSAARQGAVSNGDMGAMRAEFTRALVPLFLASGESLDRDNVTARVVGAYARALLAVGLYARFALLSPGSDAQGDFAIERDGRRIIPNDSLNLRKAVTGSVSGQTIQDANLLKVEVVYCHPLIVPFARQFVISAVRMVDHDPWNNLCYSLGRVPIRSVGVSPMHSDFWVRDR